MLPLMMGLRKPTAGRVFCVEPSLKVIPLVPWIEVGIDYAYLKNATPTKVGSMSVPLVWRADSLELPAVLFATLSIFS